MTTIPFATTMSAEDPVAVVRALTDLGLAPAERPELVEVDDRDVPVTDAWLTDSAPTATRRLFASFDEYPRHVTVFPRELAYVSIAEADIEPAQLVHDLGRVPFSIASFGRLDLDWGDYRPPSFGDRHLALGWGCAFKGAGHESLVSRRWLEQELWTLHRDEQRDVSLVQFHDLDADAAAALAHARPGHARLGNTDTTGFLQRGYVFHHDLDGIYDAARRTMTIVVHGRDVPSSEMLDWCAAIRFQSLGADRPLDRVVYVFVEEVAARRHADELWLHELEVRAIIDGQEVPLM